MSNLIRANFFRLRKNSALLFCMAAALTASVLFVLGVKYDSENMMATDEIAMQVFPFLPIAYAVFTSLFLGIEYQDGTLRNKIICGNSRLGIYLSAAAVTTVGCFAIMAAWALGCVAGVIRFGKFSSSPKELLLSALVMLFMAAATASILTMVGMLFSNRAVSAVVSILLVFGLMIIGSVIYNALCEPEFSTAAIMTAGGVRFGEPQPNPDYISGTLRTVFQFLIDALPSGQAILLANGELTRPAVSICSSAGIILLTNAVGTLIFKHKNLK